MIRVGSESRKRTLQPTVTLEMAEDNAVCFTCKQALTEGYLVVSHPEGKGLVVFSCQEHAQAATVLISRAIGRENKEN